MKITVGCPVMDRAWILPQWFDHVEKAAHTAGVSVDYAFVGDRTADPDTLAVLNERSPNCSFKDNTEPMVRRRTWNQKRYRYMAQRRNELLQLVREQGHELFLSLDSDILIHPNHLLAMIITLHTGFEAVGGKCYLTPSETEVTNYGMITRDNRVVRQDAIGAFPVDVIMALKLMTPVAYNVDYRTHMLGEDVGWSLNARKAGVRLGWNGEVCSKHVMKPSMLDTVDPRVGF